MSHGFFVFASYAITLIVMALLVLWVVFDGRARKGEIARLEEQGVKRRSSSENQAPENE